MSTLQPIDPHVVINNFNSTQFNVPKTLNVKELNTIAKDILDHVQNPMYESKISYNDYLHNVKVLWNHSYNFDNTQIVSKIYRKCMQLLSHVIRLYEKDPILLLIKFSDTPYSETDPYKISILRLLSERIHVHCNQSSKSENQSSKSENQFLNLDIKFKEFEKIINMTYNNQLDSDIDILKLYIQIDALQITSLKILLFNAIQKKIQDELFEISEASNETSLVLLRNYLSAQEDKTVLKCEYNKNLLILLEIALKNKNIVNDS